jgi:hypothetical protein
MADVVAPGILEAQVTVSCVDDVPRDFATNTVHFHINSSWISGPTGYTTLAGEVLSAFSGQTSDPAAAFGYYIDRNIQVKLFDLGDTGSEASPRVPHAVVNYTPTGGAVSRGLMAPGQIAAVLSFYGTSNTVGKRGRIYIGPFEHATPNGPQMNGTLVTNLLKLGPLLFNVGGENVAHVIFHPKATASGDAAGSYTVVQNYWVANEWATVRRRAVRATARQTVAP